jgi:AcrR family transcriptional regulator
MGHLERKIREKEEMKQRIIDAAREIASKEGWNSVTIRKIAEIIEYTPPIVYEHFENKENLIREIIGCGFIKMHESFARLIQDEPDPKEALKKLSIMHWDFAFQNSEIYQLMFSLERPPLTDEIMENIHAVEKLFLDLAKDEKAKRELILHWMCLMNGAVSVVMKMSHFPHHEEVEPRELYIRMINRFVDSI